MADKTVIKVYGNNGKEKYRLVIKGNVLAHSGTKAEIRDRLKGIPAGTNLTLIEEKSRMFFPDE